MALIRVYQSISNDVWSLTFVNEPDKLGETDKNLMRMYGEPEINVGGTYLASTLNEFVLPDKYVKLRSGFPFTQEFDAKDTPFDTNTQTKVIGYRDGLMAKINTAFDDLRENADTFSGEQVYNI